MFCQIGLVSLDGVRACFFHCIYMRAKKKYKQTTILQQCKCFETKTLKEKNENLIPRKKNS